MATRPVNRPTDPKQKEQDINNKLQLYGILTAFSNGKIPSNKQIDVALNSALASRGLASPSKRLSPEGQKLVGDLRDVIERAKILLLTKNEGNLLQDFIWQTTQISGGQASLPNAPLDKDSARAHGGDALEGLRTLGTLIISNGQFRKLLSDATILLRDIAGDAAQNAANRVNPSEDQLNQIDRPADDDTWHDVPDRGHLKDRIKQRYNEQKPFSRGEVQQAVGDASQAANPGGSRDPGDTFNQAARDQHQGTSSGINAVQGARAGLDTLREKAQQNMPDETQERGRQWKGQARDYLHDKLPRERRDQTVWRLKKMIVEIQGHEDYQRAVDTLLRLAEEYSGHTKNLTAQSRGAVKGAHTDDHLQMAEADLKTLIERFANSTSLDDLIDSINAIYRDADHDPELKGWFRNLNTFIRRCLKEQGYIMQEQSTNEWNRLYDQGHDLMRNRYRGHTDRIVDELKFFAFQFDEDEQNRAFGESMRKLFADLGHDENGNPSFKPHLLKDLTEVIIPSFFESVRYVPIPRIEYTDPMMDAIVENLVIESDNLTPNVMELASDNYWRWARKGVAGGNKNRVMFSVSGIQMDLKDVSYYIKKKQGFPSVTDSGVLDIFMGGGGFSFKIDMETADKTSRTHFFKVNKVDVNVKNLNIRLKQSKHKLLFNLFKPLLFKVVRPAIQKLLEKQIKDNVNQADAMLWKVHQEAKRAEAEAKRNPDPSNIQNIYKRYASALQQQVTKGKRKTENAAADKKVNMAMTKQDSIFKHISLPGGISTKATEYKELATKGDKWESPIFSIGSARETSNLPKIESVTRKHQQGATRGSARNDADTRGATNGFSKQVNQAFNDNPDNYKLHHSGVNGAAAVSYTAPPVGATGNARLYTDVSSQPVTSSADATTGRSNNTLLGANNPVLTGSA